MTKTAASSDVCDGASVTYSYTVTNNSDTFAWTGTLTDNVLGDVVAGEVTIGAGETVDYTLTGVITGKVTNTATATGSFGDPDTTEAVVTSDPVTVTSHACDITVTKVPAASAVCDGASVTYTYTVTNNSDEFTWTGSLTDDILGLSATGPVTIAPGDTETFTADGAITGTVTNTVTADGVLDDPDATAVSESVDATVTGEDCSITVTKTAASSDVCDGASVTYTYAVTNNSDSFTWTGTLTDGVLGDVVAGEVTIGAGETADLHPHGGHHGQGHQHRHRHGLLRRSRHHRAPSSPPTR